MNKLNEWIKQEIKQVYFQKLKKKVNSDYKKYTVYPKKKQIFQAFNLTKHCHLKVVILGQDPYHQPEQANGLAFSVHSHIPLPCSLQNIFKELKHSYPHIVLKNGDLSSWARQGVLLLNTALTVIRNKPNSHQTIGWTMFNERVIQAISKLEPFVIFVLLGNEARNKKHFIDSKKHKILETSHPSPFSAHLGFLGSNIFLKINEILKNHHQSIINWEIK